MPGEPFGPVQATSLAVHLADVIKDAIIHARLVPGQRLYEQELSKSLGVSRTPLREAVQHLIAAGWVTRLPGGGVEVSRPSLTRAIHLYEVRAVIEGLIAREVAPTLTDEQIDHLRELTDDMVRFAIKGDANATIEAGERVHNFLRELSENEVAVDILEGLHDRIDHYRNLTVRVSGRLTQVAESHQALFEALRSRDADRAESEIRQHILRASKFLVEYSDDKRA